MISMDDSYFDLPANPEDLANSRPGRRRTLVTAAGLAAVVVASAAVTGTVVHGLDGGTTATASSTTAGSSTTTAAASASSVKSVIAKVEPSVVDINTTIETTGFGGQTEEEGAGTGVIINSDGEILTNNHVIADATKITVTLSDGSTHTATVVNANSTEDLAVIKISGVTGLKAATFANSSTVAVGDSVLAIGNAEGYGGTPTVTEGIISATGRSLADTSESLTGLIQTDAALNPGNSGGPLVDSAGDVIGIDVAIATGSTDEPAQDIGFAITSNTVESYLASINATATTTS
jgi:S1-C subfamily serine protease